MKNIKIITIIAGVLFIINSCREKTPPQQQQQQPQQSQVVCPKGLSFAECNNSSALHGQIMMHNMTDNGFEVTVYTHEGIKESHHLMPGKGWSFTGILQGQRMIIAKQTTGDKIYESHCMVVGGMQHMMNITHYGVNEVEKKSHM